MLPINEGLPFAGRSWITGNGEVRGETHGSFVCEGGGDLFVIRDVEGCGVAMEENFEENLSVEAK